MLERTLLSFPKKFSKSVHKQLLFRASTPTVTNVWLLNFWFMATSIASKSYVKPSTIVLTHLVQDLKLFYCRLSEMEYCCYKDASERFCIYFHQFCMKVQTTLLMILCQGCRIFFELGYLRHQLRYFRKRQWRAVVVTQWEL